MHTANTIKFSTIIWLVMMLGSFRAKPQASRTATTPPIATTNAVHPPKKLTNDAPPPPIRGFADLHTHQFANLAFGGKAFVGAAFGPIERALPHCDYVDGGFPGNPFDWVHGPGGIRDLLGQAVKMTILPGHHVGGFPEFDGWPRWDSYTHQAMYEDWLYRALQGGLKLMVMLAVNNEFACGLIEKAPGRSCDDMEAVDLQIQAAKTMEQYIDAKSGGPGLGWYRIVTSPQQAREVINNGKLAVVLGIEVDGLFGCKLGADCSVAQVRNGLKKYFELGVRHFFPIHLNSNEYGGAALYNQLTTAALLAPLLGLVRDCSEEGYLYHHPRYQSTPEGLPLKATCNAQGLTELGKSLIKQMIRAKVIIDVNHMSALAFKDTFTIAKAYDYPVVAGHTGFLDISNGDNRHEGNLSREQVSQIRGLGGMIGIIAHQGDLDTIQTYRGGRVILEHLCGNTSETLAQAYLYAVTEMQGGPVAFGTDFNGLAGLPGPRFGPEACPGGLDLVVDWARLQYPFHIAATGGWMERSVVGHKTFDFNTDGLAHIGMLPDLIADLENLFGGRSEMLDPLLSSAEGYIKMWEKIEDSHFDIFVTPTGCSSCGDGSPENPFADLPLAVREAQGGGNIFLSPGTYLFAPNIIPKNLKLANWPGRDGTVEIH